MAVKLFKDAMPDLELETALITAVQEQNSSLLLHLLNDKQNGYRVFKSLCLRGVWKDTESKLKCKTLSWLLRTLCSRGPHLIDAALLVAATQDMFEDALKLLERGSGRMQEFVKSQLMSKSDWYFLSMHLLPHLSDEEKKEVFLRSVRENDFRKASVLCRFSNLLSDGDLHFLAAACFNGGGLQAVENVAAMVKPRHMLNSSVILKFGLQVAADCIIDPVEALALSVFRQEISCCKTYLDLSKLLLRLMKSAMDGSVAALFLGLCVDYTVPKENEDQGCLRSVPAKNTPTNLTADNVSLSNLLGFVAKLSFRLHHEALRGQDLPDGPKCDLSLMPFIVGKSWECRGETFLLKCCRHETRQNDLEANQRRLVCTIVRLLFGSCDKDTFIGFAMCHTYCSHSVNCLLYSTEPVIRSECRGIWSQAGPVLEEWVQNVDIGCAPAISHYNADWISKLHTFADWCSRSKFRNLSAFVSLTWGLWGRVEKLLAQETILAQSLCIYGARRAAKGCQTTPFLKFLKQIRDKAVVETILNEHRCNPKVFTQVSRESVWDWMMTNKGTGWQPFDILLNYQNVLSDWVIEQIARKAAYQNEWWVVQGLFGRCLLDEQLTIDLISKAVRRRESTIAEQLMKLTDISTLKQCSLITIAIYSDALPCWRNEHNGLMVCWLVRMGLAASLHCSPPARCPMELALTEMSLPLVKLLHAVGACPNPAVCFRSSRVPVTLHGHELEFEPDKVNLVEQQVLGYLSEISRKPRSLSDICRLKVSQTIGFFSERETKAKVLGLPSCLASEVLFEGAIKEYEASLCSFYCS